MTHFAGAALTTLGLLCWAAALWLTYLMSLGSASLMLIPALPFFGIAGDVMVVCGLAMLGVPLLIRRREQLKERLARFFR
jgi:hypothetical protein